MHDLAVHSNFRGDYARLDDPVPGFAHWDSTERTRMKALKVETGRRRWNVTFSLPRSDDDHINLGDPLDCPRLDAGAAP